MASLGFTSYDEVVAPPVPTTAELVAALSGPQKLAILQGFADKKLPLRLRKQIFIDEAIIAYLYRRIDAIEEFCRSLLRGEIVDVPEELDPVTGEVITPATYVTPPTTLVGLKAAVDVEFSTEFDAAQSGAIVDKMIAYSKSDGSGTTAYYLVEVKK